MRRIILPRVTRLAVPYFTTRCHKRNEFLKTCIEYKNMFFDFICKVCLKLSYSKIKRTRHCRTCANIFKQNTIYCCWVLMKLEFSRKIFRKIPKYHISRKFFQWEPRCSIRTAGGQTEGGDRHTDMTNLIVAFGNYANASNQKECQRETQSIAT